MIGIECKILQVFCSLYFDAGNRTLLNLKFNLNLNSKIFDAGNKTLLMKNE